MTRKKLPAVRNSKGHFVKGHSGNPSGRTERLLPDGQGGFISRTQLFQRDVVEAHGILLQIIRDPKAKDRDKLMGIKMLMDRALGTAKQEISITTEDEASDSPIDLGSLPLDVLRVLAEAARLNHGTIIDVDSDDDDEDHD